MMLAAIDASGLAPEDVDTYLKQQLRWAGGGYEVLLRGRLFRRGSGLTLDQRLQYLFVGTHYLLSLAMLTFMLLPAAYLLFGYSPIRSDGWTWASHYVPFYALTLLVTWLQSGGFRGSAGFCCSLLPTAYCLLPAAYCRQEGFTTAAGNLHPTWW